MTLEQQLALIEAGNLEARLLAKMAEGEIPFDPSALTKYEELAKSLTVDPNRDLRLLGRKMYEMLSETQRLNEFRQTYPEHSRTVNRQFAKVASVWDTIERTRERIVAAAEKEVAERYAKGYYS
jgi:hypothetical protein